MAQELKVGMRLHSPSGSVIVEGVEDIGPLKPFYERLAEQPDADASDDLAYNLVVDEAHTYFVGEHRVPVFDDRFVAIADQLPNPVAAAK